MKTLSFVIPVYNETERLEKTFKALEELVLPRDVKLEKVIFVNDGSSDNTYEVIKNYIHTHAAPCNASFEIISSATNKGKGYAVKTGMLNSTSEYTLFFDADMSTPLSELEKCVPYMKKDVEVIIGTRKNGHSTVIKHQPFYRELSGKAFTHLTNFMLQTSTTDYTCGFKLFKNNANHTIFSQSIINRWGYDAEIIYLAEKCNFSTQEVPVLWENDARSTVKIYKDVPRSLMDLFSILFYHKIKLFFISPIQSIPNKSYITIK